MALGFSTSYLHLFAYVLLSLAFVLPARSALIAGMTLPGERASVFGTLASMDGLCGTIGYPLAGLFAQKFGMGTSLKLSGVGLILSGLFVLLFFKEKPRLTGGQPA